MLLQCVVKIHIRKRYNQQQSVIRIQLFVAIHRVADGAYTQFVCLHIAYTQLVDKKKHLKSYQQTCGRLLIKNLSVWDLTKQKKLDSI